MEAMDKKPKGLVTAEGKRTIIHGQDLSTLFGALGYGPIGGFQVLAAVAAASVAGVYDPLTSVQESFRDLPNWEDGCPASNVPALIAPPPDFITSVLCAEAEPVNDKDVDWWVDYAQEQEEISQIYGHAIVHIKLGCSSFPFRAAYTFNGPFTHPEHDPDVVEGKPAAPILFLSNRVDPITPVKCARDMAAKYPGSGLVVQDSLGHGALISAPSNCTDQIVRKYFDTGVVPEEETFCEQECGPWDAGCSPVKTPQSTGAEKRGVLPVPRSFTRRVPFPPRFLY
jgi:pimeloyl-ACP methyl ester carboxylesterase